MFLTCSELAIFLNNLSSYCGLTDSRMRASEKDLPVKNIKFKHVWQTKKYLKWGTSYATTKTRVLIPLVPSSVEK